MSNAFRISPGHRARLRAERHFCWAAGSALAIALIILASLLGMILWQGAPGFTQAQIRLPITFDASALNAGQGKQLEEVPVSRFMLLPPQGLQAVFPEVHDHAEQHMLDGLLSGTAGISVREQLLTHPQWMGSTQEIWVPASAALGRAMKSKSAHNLLPQQQVWLKQLIEKNAVRTQFDASFFLRGDSRTSEQAGFLGAIIGSLLTVLVCLGVAFPLGVMTAVYLEEFAPKGRLVGFLELNINNLAAVPSIVFGLLGLAVYLNFLGLPRSAPLVGGLTLALMILPVIIISTRTALAAVPESIHQGALALGASPLQAVWHHSLPLALPGIMTGAILGVARALGETAPLLMIGMVAFVADVPRGFTDPATTMPVQIYLWAASPEAGFAEKTAAGILVLLLVLLALNALAIYIRRRFEVRW